MYKLEFGLPKFNMYRRILAQVLADDFVGPGIIDEAEAVSWRACCSATTRGRFSKCRNDKKAHGWQSVGLRIQGLIHSSRFLKLSSKRPPRLRMTRLPGVVIWR